MANSEIPVFESSGNLSNDLKGVVENEILGLGAWKGQIINSARNLGATHLINGYEVIGKVKIDGFLRPKYNSYTYAIKLKKYMKALGLGQDAFDSLSETWKQSSVTDIDMIWKETFAYNETSFDIGYRNIQRRISHVKSIQIEYENTVPYILADTPLEADRVAIEATELVSNLISNEFLQAKPKHIRPTVLNSFNIRYFNDVGVEILFDESFDEAIATLLVTDGKTISNLTSVTKLSERHEDILDIADEIIRTDVYVAARVLYTATDNGIGKLSNAQRDSYVEYGGAEYADKHEINILYLKETVANRFWQYLSVRIDNTLNNIQTAFGRKFFTMRKGKLYPKVEAIRHATKDELIFLFEQYLDFNVKTKSNWYDFIMDIVFAIVELIVKIGQAMYRLLQKLPIISQLEKFGRQTASTVLKVFGIDMSAEEIDEFLDENSGTGLITFLTWWMGGAGGALAGGLTSASVQQAILYLVELIATYVSQTLAVIIYTIAPLLANLVSMTVSDMVKQMADLVPMLELESEKQEMLQKIADIEEEQRKEEEDKKTATILQDGINDQNQYMPITKIDDKTFKPFEQGKEYDLQILIEGR